MAALVRSTNTLKESGLKVGHLSALDASKIFNKPVDYSIASVIFNHMVELQKPQLDSIFHALRRSYAPADAS
jgi:hypothetical protein